MSQLVRKIVVVGGGTAGWLSALHIKSALGPQAEVTLIESPNIPTIGVGEGTTPNLRSHLAFLGVDEDDCMRACGASFKNGIRFDNWCGGTGPATFIHPFFSSSKLNPDSPISPPHVWLRKFHEDPNATPLMVDACWSETQLVRQRRAPKLPKTHASAEATIAQYAWHVDAARLGTYLSSIAVKRGVRHIIDDVETVELAEPTRIVAAVTKSHGSIRGDLFLDCTGFHRLLMSQLPNEFIDFGQWLFNDRAVTARLPHEVRETGCIEACTVSTALKNGWVWHVPLYDRVGLGYVYSSRFVSDDAAEAEFLEFLGKDPEKTQRIRFRTGHYRDAWVGNCVAIGLSGGFIEPLEATGIALITYSLYQLMDLWPNTDFANILSRRFNYMLRNSYEWIRDFIVLHYCLSQRTDSQYWRAVREPSAVPESVREMLEYLEQRLPLGRWSDPRVGYRVADFSIACILAGFDRFPRFHNSYVEGLTPQQVDALLAQRAEQIRRIAAACPDHFDYLRELHADAKPGATIGVSLGS
jgi:tryptophan halogenase